MRRAPRCGTPIISYCDKCGTSTGKIRVYPYKKDHLCNIHYVQAHNVEQSKGNDNYVDNLTEGIENEFNTGD